MKKLMALCLSVLMVLSMVSFSVMAEDEAPVATFEDIANGQPAAFVTSDLALGEHVITSSNEAVIATDGTVTRPLFEDATVAIAIDGGEATNVTVKAKTTAVLYSEDFAGNAEATKSGSNWVWSGVQGWYASSANNGGSAVINGVLNMNHTDEYPADTTPDKVGRVWLYHTPGTLVNNEIVTFRFDSASVSGVGTGIDIRINVNKYDANGNKVGALNGQTVSRLNASGWGGYWMGATRKNNVEIMYDPLTGEFWGNGVKYSKNLFSEGTFESGKTADDVAKVVITNMTFVDASDGATGKYTIDNFVEYQTVPGAEVLADATPQEKSAYYSKYLEADYAIGDADLDSLTTNLNFTADEELPEGVAINWTSSNPAVIAADGTVTRPITEGTTVTVTGTLSVEGAENVVRTYTAYVLPRTLSFISETANAESLPLGSFVGAQGWSPSTIMKFERMEIGQDADGNKYYSFSTNAYEPNGSTPIYTFQDFPTSVAAGEKLVFNARVRVPVKGGLANWGLRLNNSEVAEFIYYNGYLYDSDYDLGSDGYYGAGAARTDKSVTANTWYNLRMEFYANADSATGYKVKCYIDDKLVGDHKTASRIPASITSAQFYFTGRGNANSTKDAEATDPKYYFHTDDISLKVTKSIEEILPTLTDAEKVSYFKAIVEKTILADAKVLGQTYDLDAEYAGADLAAYGVAINWASSNTALISNDGVVTGLAPAGSSATVNMTATITAGTASATVVIPVKVTDGTTLIKSLDFNSSTGNAGSAEYIADEDPAHGTVLHIDNPTAGSHKASGSLTLIDGATCLDRVILKADVKYTHNGFNGSSGGISFKTIAGMNGIQVFLNYNTNKVQIESTVPKSDGGGFKQMVAHAETLYFDMPESVIAKGEGEWVNIMVDHNVLSQTMYVYVDGILINEMPLVQASMKLTANGGSAIRGFSLELSSKGEVWVDNVSLSKYSNQNEVEVNAALNAALVDFGSETNKNILANCELPSMTIGKSWWLSGTLFNRDLDNGNLKPSNPAGYTYVTDGPTLTWTVDGQPATAINVAGPKVVTITVTATNGTYTESKTFTREVAPIAIRDLALGTADCLNGVWLDGAKGDEKVIVACYNGDALVSAKVVNLAVTEAWNPTTGTGDRFDETTGAVSNLGTGNPKVHTEYDQIKIFVVAADGITPLAFTNTELHD